MENSTQEENALVASHPSKEEERSTKKRFLGRLSLRKRSTNTTGSCDLLARIGRKLTCSPSTPPQDANDKLYLYNQKFRLADSNREAIESLTQATFTYYSLGLRYHNTAPAARASLSGSKRCKVSHEQYGIENRPWWKDPFHDAVRQMSKNCEEIAVLLNNFPFTNELAEVILEKNQENLELVVVLHTSQEKLTEGVARIEKIETQGRFKKQKIMVKTGKKRGGRRAELYSRSALPTLLFENVTYQTWQRRMEGFPLAQDPVVVKHTVTNYRLD